MSWLGMFQVTKFRTWLSSDRYQKQKMLVNKGVFCGIDRFKETRLYLCTSTAPVCWMLSRQVSLQGILGLGGYGDVPKVCSLPEKMISKTLRSVYGGVMSFPLPPSLKTRRCYSTNSNQPLPSESASATHSKSDESESCDGNQPFFQCCATDKHGANTSVFHGPSACGNGTDTSYGHCGIYNKDGPGAECEHCRINDPTSSQYRNPTVSIPVYKYN